MRAESPGLKRWRRWGALASLFALSALAGRLFEIAGAPLPWMIGPLVATAAVFMIFAPSLMVPDRIRPAGQIVVATQVGLAFSPAALDMLLQAAPVILGTAFASIACIFATAWCMARYVRQPLALAFLSAAPTSPIEAATMARAAGFDPLPVILSQTVRLAAVVIIVPVALYAIDGWPAGNRPPASFAIGDPLYICALVVIGVAGAKIFRKAGVPNPNFLGPMTTSAVISASGLLVASYPPLVLAGAQIVLGTWLGSTFRRELVTTALRISLFGLASAFMLLALCSLCAVVIAGLWGMDWRTLVLGAAPGGAVEMALTAKFLHQNVAMITTIHLVRIFILMPNIPWIVRQLARLDTQKGSTP